MKICIVSQTFAPQPEGGAEIVCRQLAQSLSGAHEVVVLSLGMTGNALAPPGEIISNAPYRLWRLPFHNSQLPSVGQLQMSWGGKLIWHLRSAIGAVAPADIRAFLKKEAFDLIYAHNAVRMQPALYKVAAEIGLPVVQHLHDYALLCARTTMFDHDRNCTVPCTECRILTARARVASRTVGDVISVSRFVEDRYRAHGVFGNASMHVLHNFNLPDTSQVPRPAAIAKDDPGVFTFAYLSALTPEKGVEILLSTFRALCEQPGQRPPIQLLVAGRGDAGYQRKLRAMVAGSAAEARVKWLGFVAPETVYDRADVVIVPSLWHEPQSRILIEAAGCGVPVIAAMTGGTTEVVNQCQTGWLYGATDSQQLLSLMQRAAQFKPDGWQREKAALFPGLTAFQGSIGQSDYLPALEDILLQAVRASAQGKSQQ